MWIKRALFTILFATLAVRVQGQSTPVITNVYSGGIHFETPHFSDDENCLYWADTNQQRYYRRDMSTGNVTYREIEYGLTSVIVRVKDYPKLLLVSSRSELYFLSWDAPAGDTSLRQLTAVDIGLPDNRCNDAKVDAKGRLWFGTMAKYQPNGTVDTDKGSVYLLTQLNYANPPIKIRPVSVSNGIAWNANNTLMFYIDSVPRNINVYVFDLETATIRNRTTLFNLEANNITGYPDGMTIDRDDNLWVACFGAGLVIKVSSSTGQIMERYELPVKQVTSVMWGGENLATLYVTTSNYGMTTEQLALEPEAGSLFSIENTGSCGYPQNQFVFPNANTY